MAAVFTQYNPAWLNQIAPDRFEDQDLFRIVTFYVFHSPCAGLSARGRSLEEYGWSAPWKKPYYLNKQLKQAASNYELLYSADGYEKMDEALGSANMLRDFPLDMSVERASFTDCKKNQFLSLFSHIRNSLAHGRLNMMDVNNECVFAFEDVSPKKDNEGRNKVSARMILRKSTLLRWIDIIESGEEEYQGNTQE